jgi:signal transduction histidine kinase
LKIQNENVLGIIIDSVGISLDILNVLKNKTEDDTEISYNDGLKSFRIIKYPIKNYYGSRLIVIRDITERVKQTKELIKAKERAEESDNLKSAFLTNMSHEIRTPMNGIMGFAELLKEPKLTGIEQKEYIRIIKESGTRMLNIIDDIICISSLETGHIKASFSIVNITELVQSVYCFYKPLAIDKNIKLILINNILEQDSKIKTDEKKVYSILNNIINNAIKFTPSGYVEIQCTNKQCELEFSVKDTGLGISPEQKNIIFMNFRHGNEFINKNFDGAGLGLSISKAYVEMIGGRIWVESEQQKGSTFYFTIPFIPV